MKQYRPEYYAYDFNDISRKVSIEELIDLKDYANKHSIDQI